MLNEKLFLFIYRIFKQYKDRNDFVLSFLICEYCIYEKWNFNPRLQKMIYGALGVCHWVH